MRRLRAWELKGKGWKQKDIAEALGVSEGAVSQWVKRAEAGGEEALYTRRGGGPAARLNEEQLRRLPALLEKGAEHFGFRGDIWTRARVATLIEREFGVRYSTVHVGRLLKALRWSSQKPVKRASQRDEAAIERWQAERWPELEKKPSRKDER
jgi:transposase